MKGDQDSKFSSNRAEIMVIVVSDSRTGLIPMPRIHRRKLLAGIGSIATIGAASQLATANKPEVSELLNRPRFVEVGVTHSGAPDYPIGNTDNFAEYLIDPERNELLMTNAVGEANRNRLIQRGAIVAGDQVRSIEKPMFGNEDDRLMISKDKWLELEENYHSPEVAVSSMSDDSITATVENREVVVNDGEGKDLELPSETVKVRKRGPGRREILDPRTGGTLLVSEYSMGSVTVTPVVKVNNYGKMNVREKKGVKNNAVH